MTDYKIYIVGFSPFESSSFASFFRLASRRRIRYELTPLATEADLLLINADAQGAAQEIAKKLRTQKILLVGSSDKGTGLPYHPRPYTLMSLLAELDKILSPQFADTVHMSDMMSGRASARVEEHPLFRTPDYGAAQHAASSAAAAQPAAQSKAPVLDIGINRSGLAPSLTEQYGLPDSALDDPDCDNILVVDDSDIALKFMQNRLHHFGYRAELASSGEDALAMIAKRQYQYVFLDVMMKGMDGYQTCRAIKQRKYSTGYPPVVIMLTSRGGTIDKIRGTLAGCEAYLTKPIKEVELIRALDIKNSKAPNTGAANTSSPASTRRLGSKKL